MSTLTDPTNSTRSTPTIDAANATLHIGSSTFIPASSNQVWAALTNTSTWPSWNSFVPRVTIRSQPDSPEPQTPTQSQSQQSQEQQEPSPILRKGSKITFHVRMDPQSSKPQAARDVHLVVTECDPPNAETGTTGRLVWVADHDAQGSMPASLLKAERVHEVVDVERRDEGGAGMIRGTEVRNWEAQVGWVVHVVKLLYGKQLQRNFEGWVEDLKGFVVSGSGE